MVRGRGALSRRRAVGRSLLCAIIVLVSGACEPASAAPSRFVGPPQITSFGRREAQLLRPLVLAVQGEVVDPAAIRFTETPYMLRGHVQRGSSIGAFGRCVSCYELQWEMSAGPRVWAVFVPGKPVTFSLIQGGRGSAYLAWLSGGVMGFGDLSVTRPVSKALADCLISITGGSSRLPKIVVFDDQLPRAYFTSRHEDHNLTVESIVRKPCGGYVVRIRGNLPFCFTFVGSGHEWRVTWASKNQLWLLAFGIISAALCASLLRRKYRRRNG